MNQPTIEIIQLENGDVVLRHSQVPTQPLVTVSFSSHVVGSIPGSELDMARAMLEAGMQKFEEIQATQMLEFNEASASGMIH